MAFYPLQRGCGVEKRPARGNLACFGCLLLLEAILFAIALPNMLGATQRGKQKRTMSDMLTVATAVEYCAVDKLRYPGVRSIEELVPLLVYPEGSQPDP